MRTKQVFLSLGANLGDRVQNLQQALALLTAKGIQIVRQSSVYETEPQDVREQPWFLNIAVECRTAAFPLQLLSTLQEIEKQLGRDRRAQTIAKGPRFIDIDILLYGRAVINSPRLTVPHPRMTERRFVLEPLLELNTDLRNPATGESFKDCLGRIRHQIVRIYSQ
jgi:2-amino-4-hydroxy-6-hydroxymethyldihydropteridine diphosphokinase